MRKFNKIIIFFAALLIWSCEDTEFPKTSESEYIGNYVAFNVESVSVDENNVVTTADGVTTSTNNTYTVTLFRSTEDLSNELVVNVSASAKFIADSDFANAGDDASNNLTINGNLASLTIPANEITAEFYFSTLNNSIATGDIELTFTITGVSDASYSIGVNTTKARSSLKCTIVDDDCPFNVDKLTGTFEAVQIDLDGNGNRTVEGTYEVTIEQDAGNPLVLNVMGLVSELYGTVDNMVTPLNLVTCRKAAVYPALSAMGIYNPSGDFVTFERRDGAFAGEAGPAFEQNGLIFEDDASWVTYDDEAGKITIYAWLSVPALGSFGAKQFDLTKVE